MPMPEVFGIKIDNINESIDENALRHLFQKEPFQVYSVRIGENKRHAYVNFFTESNAIIAVNYLNNQSFNGTKLRVTIAPKKDFKKVTDCKFGDLCLNTVSIFFVFFF